MSSVEGLDELLAKLSGLGGDIKESSRKGLERGAKKIQKNAKYLVPVDTGNLRNSIKTKSKETQIGAEAQVFTNLEYAPYVEFGTGQRGRESNINRPQRSFLQSKLERTNCSTIPYTCISIRKKYRRSRTRSNQGNKTRN